MINFFLAITTRVWYRGLGPGGLLDCQVACRLRSPTRATLGKFQKVHFKAVNFKKCSNFKKTSKKSKKVSIPLQKKLLTKLYAQSIIAVMNLVKISPENLEVANAYLQNGSIQQVARSLAISENDVTEILARREVRAYIDSIYLDYGYRNRFKLAETLDLLINEKLREAESTEMYTNKDLADLLQLAHKMRMDEIRAMTEYEKSRETRIQNQTNVQINETPFGAGNYGKLMEKLLQS